MKLEVLRFSSQKDSTSGILFDISNNKRKFLCYTLEDEARIEKVRGETCIPAGEYSLGLRTVGGLDARYSQENNILVKDGFIGRSTLAYMRTYPAIAEALSRGAEVTIKYTDYDK